MKMTSLRSAACFSLLAVGCAGGTPPAASPEPTSSESPAAEKPASEKPAPRADVLYAAPATVPKAPVQCVAGTALPARKSCPDALAQLAAAVEKTGEALDAALVPLEACSEFPAGLVRALRAESGLVACADVLVEPVVGEGVDSSALDPEWRETLVALGLGARLRRLADAPPAPPAERDKATLQAYFQDSLFPWVSTQATAIYAMAAQGAALHGYAKGTVAIEAGMADMRFVEITRAVPLPTEMEKDAEVRDVYYATLDDALEPRKARGRDAALVGLREYAHVGVLASSRVDAARSLLSRVFGGQRMTSLDRFLLPPAPATTLTSNEQKLAAHLPANFASVLLAQQPLETNFVRATLARGIPVALRRSIESGGGSSERLALGRALIESGRLYFRSEDFQAAAQLLGALLDDAPQPPLDAASLESARFLRALAIALSAGPTDATDLLARGPRFADALGNLALLDSLGDSTSPHAGRAQFDAAYLRELVAPAGSPDAWKEIGALYKKAATRLTGAEKTVASDRAKAAAATEKELRKPTPKQ